MASLASDDPRRSTTDPRWVAPERHSALERLFLPVMRDPRDLIFIRTAAVMSATAVPMAIAMFFAPPWLIGVLALPYIGFIFLGFGGRYGLMLHATGHRSIWQKQYAFFQHYITALGFLLGHTPTSFHAHHMWMHHAENNMHGDGSCTLAYRRDYFPHFVHYWARFFFLGYFNVSRYLWLRGRTRILRKFVLGELFWFALVAVAWQVNWAATLLVLIVPMLLIRWLMMAGNWAQHAFIDIENPDDGFGNSTCLTNTNYNHKCYNDGYHIVHHNKPGMHWTEMALAYENNIQEYIDKDAVVFDGIADNQQIWFLLMFGKYDKLAKHLVNFHDRTEEEKVAFLKKRVQDRLGEMPSFFEFETVAKMKATDRHSSVPVEQQLVAE